MRPHFLDTKVNIIVMRKSKINTALSITEILLDYIFEAAKLLPLPLETPYEHIRRIRNLGPGDVRRHFYRMNQRGLVKVTNSRGIKLVSLTTKGKLKILFRKARLKSKAKWDGKWRLVVFDIPEQQRVARARLRQMLMGNGYKKLQASVFISPSPLNREAIEYLNASGLSRYIRVMRIEEIDSEQSLLTIFKLKKN